MYRFLIPLCCLSLLSAAAWHLFTHGNYPFCVLFVCGAVGCILLVIYQLNATNRKLTYFFSALKNDDYAIRFIENEGVQSERMLNAILNQIKEIIQNARLEIQQKERYYELILNNISSGVVAIDDKGFVIQSNQFALRILGLEVFTHVSQLMRVSSQLCETFKKIRTGENRRITYTNERGHIQLLINATAITIKGKNIRLLVINDIENEMDEKEIDSWIRLIRVLAHEIMNSVAPITSLSDTLLDIHKNNTLSTEQIRHNTISGLQVISETGKGLISFVESYRKFTRIPKPECEWMELNEFIQRMVILCSMEPDFANIRIHTSITPENLKIWADPNLLGQVMLNLMKNAIQSLEHQTVPCISIVAGQTTAGTIRIQVIDNGPGIPADIINEIFVPFFTTKKEGTGIGLSIARQILRAHGGNLKVSSIPGKETVFTLTI